MLVQEEELYRKKNYIAEEKRQIQEVFLTVYIKGDNIKISNNVFWQCKNYTIKFE